MDHAVKILNHMMLAPEELRDELYCQICKQSTNNPDPQSTEKGWQLLMMCLAIFPPSSDLMPHLMAYCAAALTSEVPNVAGYAEICLHRIPKICRLGPRREMPTKIELEALRRGGTVVLRIFFLDDKYCNLRADSWTTARETEDTIAKLLNISNDKPFSLFEVSSAEEERVLDPDERVMDLIAFWQRTSLEEMSKVGKCK
jgi:myosin VIIa